MRIYGTRTIPAAIRQKKDIVAKFGAKVRPLTVDDFEIVPEHDEEYLVGCRCDFCGWYGETQECERVTLFSIQVLNLETEMFVEDDYFEDDVEICAACLTTKVVPYLESLRQDADVLNTLIVAESEVQVPDMQKHTLQTPLIGEEDNHDSLLLPPLSDNEPF